MLDHFLDLSRRSHAFEYRDAQSRRDSRPEWTGENSINHGIRLPIAFSNDNTPYGDRGSTLEAVPFLVQVLRSRRVLIERSA